MPEQEPLGLRLSNDRIPVHLGEVLLGYARFRLDGHLQMINAPDDEERARSQAALANRGWIEEKAEAPAAEQQERSGPLTAQLTALVVHQELDGRIPIHLAPGVVGYALLRPDAQLQLEQPMPLWRLDEQATRIPVTQAEAGVGYGVDRDALGRLVRDEWMAWAREQHPEFRKSSWLIPWEELSEAEREVDRRIGERLYVEGAGFHQLAVETLEAAAGKTIPSQRAAGLIRYHLQNAEISPADRAELAAFADMLDASVPDRA